MAFTRHVYPQLNFVFTQGTGIVDDHALLIQMLGLHVESKRLRYIRELVDMRKIRRTTNVTVQGFIRVAEMQKELFQDRDFRAAILADTAAIGKEAEIYSMLVSTMNLQIRAFQGRIDEPISWLGFDGEDRVRIRRYINTHIS